MESGKRTEAGSSASCSSASVNAEKQQKLVDMIDKSQENVDSCDKAVDEDDDSDDGVAAAFVPSPLLPLKEQLEKDKGDESLRRWKQTLLGCVESDLSDHVEPEVNFQSIGIISDEFREVKTRLPIDESERDHVLFTLEEGSRYRLKLTFCVLHNIVSGLTYSNTVWKGVQVYQNKGMLGSFAPQPDPYVHTLDEETTPTGVFARGIYSAKLKFEDDDKRCHLELKYSFEIRKRR